MIYRKKIVPLLLALTLTAPATFSAAEEGDMRCSLYGSIGGSMGKFMLPLTMQDFVNIMTGKDPALLNELSNSLLASVNRQELAALGKMPEKDRELFSESAGQAAIENLMSARATSSEELKSLMTSACKSVGAQGIIDNQRRANALTEANLGR